jgi:TolB-like protein
MQRRLAAILAADVVGYSALMGADEARALGAIRRLRDELFEPVVAAHRGEIFKRMGDGWLVEFASVVDAVDCAAAVQERLADEDVTLRIGVHLGDIVNDGGEIYGDGVNIAARLEAEAAPGGMLVSDDVARQVAGKSQVALTDAGERRFKNIAAPVKVREALFGAAVSSRKAIAEVVGDLPVLPDKPSVAVLPFDDMSAGADEAYFADGVVEDIITELARFPGLFVIARNSSFSYRGSAVDVRRVSRELGVRYVVEGSVRRARGRVRVTAQLVDAATGAHVWAERYDRDLDDIFAVQEEITASIVAAIAPQIEQSELNRIRSRQDVAASVYDAALKAKAAGIDALRFGKPEQARAAIAMAEEALGRDPRCTLALLTQARTLMYLHLYRWEREGEDALAMATERLERLSELDNMNAEACVVRGTCLSIGGDHDGGLVEYRRAVELNPNSAAALIHLAWGESIDGAEEEARAHAADGLRLSPREAPFILGIAYLALAQAAFAEKDYVETRKWGRLAVQMSPRAPIRRALMVASSAFSGDFEAAREHRARLDAFAPEFAPRILDGTTPLYTDARCNARLAEGLRLGEAGG